MTKDYCNNIILANNNYIAFDIGNVLFHFDLSPLLDILMELNIISESKSVDQFIGGSFQHTQEIGLSNIKDSFYQLNPNLSESALQKIKDQWINTFYPSLPMISIVEDLIKRGDCVALLSNIGPDHAFVVRNECKIFDKCIQHFSCEIGARKPTRLYFQSFILQHGWGSNTKYFDDRKDNISIGNEYFNSIYFDINNFSSDEEAARVMRSYLDI